MARPTIHDVARRAGVSLSTVDRVLNGRAGVRAATRERVETVMRDIGFVRDLAAANLSKRRRYRFLFLLPRGDNAFLRGLEAALRAECPGALAQRMEIACETVPPLDPDALARRLDAVEPGVDGVALVATEGAALREAVRRAATRGLAVVTLVSDLPGTARAGFVGIDNVAAGRCAAGLLGRFCRGRSGPVALLAGAMVLRDHAERRLGFEQVMQAEFPCLEVLPPLEGRDEDGRVERLARDLLDRHPRLAGIYSLGAGNQGLIRALEGRADPPCVVAHELADHTREALISGRIDAVLHQDPGAEIRAAIAMLRAQADGEAMPAPRIGIEVFLRDNLP
ncbi:LacI family DNA-binding transcriptional regulator [Limimaricola pyoseonensis]|uniref:Transcriptional regulator, LacI family n=1 Tax=Limimaricola pyoseonensis TaxID=521013 RepID=A0A1G7H6S5_9RHOB|nr:LacI family DNA-binding transcriptional regulator [Limimaricola pyoseonensis]SDE96075.1 transcriptional regulator, LacI family [Limimaricola pyoseonensis]